MSFDASRSQSPGAIWKAYHDAQLQAFKSLFPGGNYGSWSCKRLVEESKSRFPQMKNAVLLVVQQDLLTSIGLRRTMLEQFPFGNARATRGHVIFIQILEEITHGIQQHCRENGVAHVPSKNDESLRAETRIDETGNPAPHYDGLACSNFVDAMVRSIAQICHTWQRVVKGDLEVSTGAAGNKWR